MVLPHPANKVEDGHKRPYGVVVTAHCHVREADVVIRGYMASSYSRKECLWDLS